MIRTIRRPRTPLCIERVVLLLQLLQRRFFSVFIISVSLLLLFHSPVVVDGATKFQVHLPQSLNRDSGYPHRPALFGPRPRGQSIQGPLHYREGDDFCHSDHDGRRRRNSWNHSSHSHNPDTTINDENDNNNNNNTVELVPQNKDRYYRSNNNNNNNDDDDDDDCCSPSFMIWMIRRSENCHFVQQVRNAQQAGAAAVVIANTICHCDHRDCIPAANDELCETIPPSLADDGSGGDIGIPAFFLDKQDADPIESALLLLSSSSSDAKVFVELSFPLVINHPTRNNRNEEDDEKTKKQEPNVSVDLDFWSLPYYNNNNDDDVTADLWSLYRQMFAHDRVRFTPHYAIFDGIQAGCSESQEGDENDHDKNDGRCGTLCTNHGRYCATTSITKEEDNNAATFVPLGADIVTESLRRICIFQIYERPQYPHYIPPEERPTWTWWNYVQEFETTCNNLNLTTSTTMDQCILNVYRTVGIRKELIDNCMNDSGGVDRDNSNNLLEEQLFLRRRQGNVWVPSLLVDGIPVIQKNRQDFFWNGPVRNTLTAICDALYPETSLALETTSNINDLLCNNCRFCPCVEDCIRNHGVCRSCPDISNSNNTKHCKATAGQSKLGIFTTLVPVPVAVAVIIVLASMAVGAMIGSKYQERRRQPQEIVWTESAASPTTRPEQLERQLLHAALNPENENDPDTTESSDSSIMSSNL